MDIDIFSSNNGGSTSPRCDTGLVNRAVMADKSSGELPMADVHQKLFMGDRGALKDVWLTTHAMTNVSGDHGPRLSCVRFRNSRC